MNGLAARSTVWGATSAPLPYDAAGIRTLTTRLAEDGSPHHRLEGGSPYGRAGARPSRAEPQRARCPVPDADERADRPFYGVG